MRHLSPSRLCVLLGLALAAAPFFAGAPGCSSVAHIDCPGIFDLDRIGPDGDPDPCCARTSPCPPPGAGKDGGKDAATDAAADADGGPPCTGDCPDADAPEVCLETCVPQPALGWFGPVLLWKGNAGETIDCPAAAPELAYTGFADLVDAGPASCGACGCELAHDNACGPPEHLTASTAACPGTAGFTKPFDPPPGWDGGCSSFDNIIGAKSLINSPLTLTEVCTADAGAPAAPATPAAFGSAIVACLEKPAPGCDLEHVCAPTDPAFQSCIYQPADVVTCPPSYPTRIAVAAGFNDQRACTPCGCDVTAGSCTATLAVYGDTACSALLFARTIDSTMTAMPPCEDVTPPGALGSKTLTGIKYTPGTCTPSGGEPTDGGVVATGVATFCCLPEAAP
jgi:hypothetical protein